MSKPSPYLGGKTTRKVRLINAETDPDMQTQEDFNKSVSGRLDGLDAGVPDVDLSDYATIVYSDAEDDKLDVRITALENAPGGGGGGIEEAPTDDAIYGRKNAGWVEVTAAGEESQPFIKWHQFAVIKRSTRFDYDPCLLYTSDAADG